MLPQFRLHSMAEWGINKIEFEIIIQTENYTCEDSEKYKIFLGEAKN